MTTTSSRQASTGVAATHDTSAPPVAGEPSSFPTHAECVRTLLGDGGFATLTTSTAEGATPGGYPYGSLAAYSVMADGSILLCLSDMAEHTAIDHMNADHADANLEMARHLGGLAAATSARIHAIDRHGVTLYADLDGVVHTVRLRFPDGPLASAGDLRAAVVDLARRAREAAAA